MAYLKIALPAFTVIGIAGSSDDGEGFVHRVWDEANRRFGEVAGIAKYNEQGQPAVWGLMSDMGMGFRPWEDGFSKGRYLAGVEVEDDAVAPEGWEKWVSPAYEYIVAPQDGPDAFHRAISWLTGNGMHLAGAAYDRIMPGTDGFIFLPIRKII